MGDMLIRGVDQVVVDNIKLAAKQRGLSVNRLVAETLAEHFAGDAQRQYHDLDALAGTWSSKDLKDFEAAIKPLTIPEEGLWPKRRGRARK
jgi:phosphopantetheinyl transferase (holo-ACP synthase)